MKIKIKDILHLKTVNKQDKCVVKGCLNWGHPRYKSGSIIDYYVLCNGHRRLARDRFNGNVPENYIPSLSRYIYPEHPKCAVRDCVGYCQTKGVNRIGVRKYSRFCPFHDKSSNRNRLPDKVAYTDYTLPMPPLVNEEYGDFPIINCMVNGCNNPAKIGRGRNGGIRRYDRCPHHCYLHRLHLPDDYAFTPLKSLKYERHKCIVSGCERLQANKGIYNGQRRYDAYCEHHRRGRMKVEKKGKLKVNTNKCSRCGWEGACDKHRIVNGKDGGKYEIGNVIVVCPNCHRLIHKGLK